MSQRKTTPPLRRPSFIALVAALALSASFLGAQSVVRTHAGTADQDRLGSAVAGQGDFDMDGTPDYAVGSPGHDAGAGPDQGRVQVFSGADGSLLFAATGAAAGDRFGAAVSLAGDVDGDGFDDLAVGAPLRDAGLGAEQGEVIVYSGQTSAVIHTLSGATAGDRFGVAVAIIGDTGVDGLAEFAVGAPRYDGTAGADAGRVVVYDGQLGTPLYTLDGAGAGDFYGSAVAGVGDSDGDLIPDFVIGAPSFDGTAGADSGRIAILSGSTGMELQSAEGSQAGAELGTAVSGAGDVNADQRGDVVAGAPLFDGAAGADSGQVTVFNGSDASTVWSLEGSVADVRLGAAVSGGDDVDGDGFDDVVAGAPLFDGAAGADSGRTRVLAGNDGAQIFELEGAVAGDQEGAAVAVVGDVSGNTRADVASGAPEVAAGGSARGRLTVMLSDLIATSEVRAYATASQPRAVTAADADGDGDLDLIIACGATLSVLWNGDQSGGVARARFDDAARSDLALSPGASAVSVAAADMDGDAALEIVVGRSDGTVDLLDGTGSGATTSFALTGSSPLVVDPSPTPGFIADLAIQGSGSAAVVVCAGAGTLTSPGFIDTIGSPFGTPMLGGVLVTGGAFQAVVVGDIDGDLSDDIIAANSSSGASGGVHVLIGPAYAAAVGSPFSAGVPPRDVALADLDGDDLSDDVAVASLGLTAGGVRVLPDYVIGTGFGSAFDPGLSLARAVVSANLDGIAGDDLAVLDAAGDLVRLLGFTGASFAATLTGATGEGAGEALIAAQLTQGGTTLADTDEIATVHLSTDIAAVFRVRRPFDLIRVAGTGCPAGAPTAIIDISTDPVIGAYGMGIELSGAGLLSLAFIVVQTNAPAGSMPTVTNVSGCGLASSAGDLVQYFTYTDIAGMAALPAGLNDDPDLIGLEFLLQWGILDGGPIQGALSASDAIVLTIGEN